MESAPTCSRSPSMIVILSLLLSLLFYDSTVKYDNPVRWLRQVQQHCQIFVFPPSLAHISTPVSVSCPYLHTRLGLLPISPYPSGSICSLYHSQYLLPLHNRLHLVYEDTTHTLSPGILGGSHDAHGRCDLERLRAQRPRAPRAPAPRTVSL